jgi:hypothetical protein
MMGPRLETLGPVRSRDMEFGIFPLLSLSKKIHEFLIIRNSHGYSVPVQCPRQGLSMRILRIRF